MTEQTADDALAADERKRQVRGLLEPFFGAGQWSETKPRFTPAAEAIDDFYAAILTRRDRDTWNRAIEAAAVEVEQWFPHGTIGQPRYAAGKTLRDAIARLKDQGHG